MGERPECVKIVLELTRMLQTLFFKFNATKFRKNRQLVKRYDTVFIKCVVLRILWGKIRKPGAAVKGGCYLNAVAVKVRVDFQGVLVSDSLEKAKL